MSLVLVASIPDAIEEWQQIVPDINFEGVLADWPVEVAIHQQAIETKLRFRCQFMSKGVANRLEHINRSMRLTARRPGASTGRQFRGDCDIAVRLLGEPPAKDILLSGVAGKRIAEAALELVRDDHDRNIVWD